MIMEVKKTFAQIFPKYKPSGDVESITRDIDVYRVVTDRENSQISVYFKACYLMEKKDLRKIEDGLKSAMCPEGTVRFRLCESYNLSELYTPGVLFEKYRSSIEDEIHDINPIMEHIFHMAEYSFDAESGTITLSLKDNVMARRLKDELIEFLEYVFCDRCNVPARFNVVFTKGEISRSLTDARVRAQNQARCIVENYSAARGEGFGADGADESASDENRALADKASSASDSSHGEKSGSNTGARSTSSGFDKSYSGKGRGRSSSKKTGKFTGFARPDMVYGRDFDETISVRGQEKSLLLPISEVITEMGDVVLRGKIFQVEHKDFPARQKGMTRFVLTDFTDSIAVKLFYDIEYFDEANAAIKAGMFVKVRGRVGFDSYDNELVLSFPVGIKAIADFRTKRTDGAPQKRVELHCHTKMSDMDAVSDVTDIMKRAKEWEMGALAITDHGVVQAFTPAYHELKKGDPFKLLYGVEGYLVDDEAKCVTNSHGQSLMDEYIVYSIRTSGFSPANDHIIQISAVKISRGAVADTFERYIRPGEPLSYETVKRTGIDDSTVKAAPGIEEVIPEFLSFAGDGVLVCHESSMGEAFLSNAAKKVGMDREFTVLDINELSVYLVAKKYNKLSTAAKELKLPLDEVPTAAQERDVVAGLFFKFADILSEQGIKDLDDVNERFGTMDVNAIKHKDYYHIILLAKNEIGRNNLYKLVSESHLNFYAKRPRIPKSMLAENREGIIIGSACEQGELFMALRRGESPDRIARIVEFYDYLEVQPIGNNAFLVREGKVKDDEGLRDFNRKIVELGERYNKPVCATCDVHFLDPEDAIYRSIVLAGKGFDDADLQPPLYLHTTDEMMEEFSYLGYEKAREIVITNTNMIADMIDRIPPVRPDKCPPVIENSDEDLKNICYTKAHRMYGENLPAPVAERLEKELNSIIKNGFAVMYIIAQKLVKKSNDDGYVVGSRGSVGSSFVAFMADITEVNSLSAHYYCENCHYSDFDSEDVKKFAGSSGCDMPDKDCPVCGKRLKKDGFDIPFETFLGFNGDKEPDIDLNFSGEYQGRAHRFTGELFGEENTFKAGTISALKDKKAEGYVLAYFKERNITKRWCEIQRNALGISGVKNSTGQHPGGIVVLPKGEKIYTFTPVQYPANKEEKGVITTHFDYHSIDHNLLKLDILGHMDPSMMRFFTVHSDVDPVDVPLDDKDVMSLFISPDVLGIKPDDIGGFLTGTLGIPEFGTRFAMKMLVDTNPRSFTDLIRIAGLAHGTDVYKGNAETLIKEGIATLSTAICTRDDIMIYLINQGVEPSLSFKIMEAIRKGNVAKGKVPDWEDMKKEMIAHGVPQWYVTSGETIKYMFPKAHAAAYVMMAWRVSWYKINRPLIYYSAFYTVRAVKTMSYEKMCQGLEKLDFYIKQYNDKNNSDEEDTSSTEDDQITVMWLVREMYCRGFEFMPMDLSMAKATEFQVVDGKILPSVLSIDNVGESAAQSIEEAARSGKFLSMEDFKNRAKVSETIANKIYDMGLLGDVPKSNQMSLFDLM